MSCLSRRCHRASITYLEIFIVDVGAFPTLPTPAALEPAVVAFLFQIVVALLFRIVVVFLFRIVVAFLFQIVVAFLFQIHAKVVTCYNQG